jgi:hypothetical protein
MQIQLKETKITKEIKKMGGLTPPKETFERNWFKLEHELKKRDKYFWKHIVWKPWDHPGGWVTLVACLCLTISGFRYQWIQEDNNDLASYLLTVSNFATYLNRDNGGVAVPILLTEPSNTLGDILLSDEDHTDVLSGDEILL